MDHAQYETTATTLMPEFLNDMKALYYNFTFLHLDETDNNGHLYGWHSTEYNNAVKRADRFLDDIFGMIESTPESTDSTAIILTADHGGCGVNTFDHGDPTHPEDYTIPFYVWGPGVTSGDLYDLNSATRVDPGTSRPTYGSETQPIWHSNAANLIADFFGLSLESVVFNANQDLCVMASGCTSIPHSPPSTSSTTVSSSAKPP